MRSVRTLVIQIAVLCMLLAPAYAQTAQGPSANGTRPPTPFLPVPTSGYDGTYVRAFKTDSTGQLYIANPGGGGTTTMTTTTYPASPPSNPAGTTSVPIYSTPAGLLKSSIDAWTAGTIGVTQSGSWTILPGNTANTTPWLFTINQGGNSASVTGASALKVDNSAVTQPISATSLPLPTGAASLAKQPALGTAGVSSADVLSVQGIASGTPLPISAASLPLPAGAATNTVLTDGTQKSQIVSSGGTSATVAVTAPASTDAGVVVRNIARRDTSTLTTATLGGGAVYTSAWFDTNASGSAFVEVEAYSDVASAASGLIIQESDDTGNANFTRSAVSASVSAVTLAQTFARVACRYWRVQYTNGAGAQASFELTATTSNGPNPSTNGSGQLLSVQQGTWTVQVGNTPNTTAILTSTRPATSGGDTLIKFLSASGTNATSTKGAAGQLYSYQLSNTNAAIRYVHFYNKATSPSVGTDVPVFTVAVPASGCVAWHDNNGIAFSTGIAYSITTGAADNDSGSAGANDIVGVGSYN